MTGYRSQEAGLWLASPMWTVLSVSPLDEDHLFLQTLAGHSSLALVKASDLASASALLQQCEIAVVVCERNLLPGTWIDVLAHIEALPNAPSLIVASRLADESLWAQALNLGAWDVLAKPFDPDEVNRSLKSGLRRWREQRSFTSSVPPQKETAPAA